MVEFTLRDFMGVVAAMSSVALVLAAIGAAGLAVTRWARRRGRRPWLWVLAAYAAVNVAIGLAEVVLGRGR